MATAPTNLSELCSGLNALGQQLQLSLEMSHRGRQKNLIIILYSKALKTFQEIQDATQAGDLSHARKRLSELVDTCFTTVAVIVNSSVGDSFYQDRDRARIYRRRTYQALPRDVGQSIQNRGGRHFAAEAGMLPYFEALQGYLEPIGDNRPNASDNHSDIMIPACEGMLLAARHVTEFFRVYELDKEFYDYWRRYSDLATPH